jgi:hypothetical protein
MNQDSFQQAHLNELERLATESASDPLLGPQDKQRLDRFRQSAAKITPQNDVSASRAAFFLRGRGVTGTTGIDSLLAGKTLTHCAQMFTEQAKVEERDAARKGGRERRRRGSGTPSMLFTGTPRGSFGFEFAPITSDPALLPIHAAALDKLVHVIANVAAGDAAVDATVPDVVLPHLKLFFKDLAAFDVSLRIATSSGFRQDLTAGTVRQTAERLAEEISENTVELIGEFRGLTLDSGRFDFRPAAGDEFSGEVSEDLTDAQLLTINKLTGTPCVATVLERTVTHPGRKPAVSYILFNLVSQGNQNIPDKS